MYAIRSYYGRIEEACIDLDMAVSLGHDEAISYLEENCK